MKKLLNTVLGVLLFFYMGNYAPARPSLPSDEIVLVPLCNGSEYRIQTSGNGTHIDIFSKALGIDPIMKNRKYSNSSAAFHSKDLKKLEQLAKKIDTNKDKTLSLNELYYAGIY